MSISTTIKDGWGQDTEACVTSRGQLVVAPLDFSLAYTQVALLNNTAFSFVPPLPGKRFIVTDILLYANKGVGANDANVTIYEAGSETSTTVDRTILSVEMLKQTSRDMIGLNLIISEGKWLNIKTDDNTIFSTVMGYYVAA